MPENSDTLMHVRMAANAVGFRLFRECDALWHGAETDRVSLPRSELRELLARFRHAVAEAAEVERFQRILVEYQSFDQNLHRRNPELRQILSAPGQDGADVSFVYEPAALLRVIEACAESGVERVGASRSEARVIPVQPG